uniref:LRRCT domain-containing protein n=1 Tax=Branchiostoma floridae TaxID=7739 RepID=C4A0V4_BRAFL|eukprot:XP_002585572.1 hypothetical protein BRAFLDRAFT_111808 [Branchiostoma floridae]
MGRKLQHLLMFLLIILKEPNMQVDGCRCAPSPYCKCLNNQGLTSIPQSLPASIKQLELKRNQITMIQSGAFANVSRLQELNLASNKIKTIQEGAIANLPQLKELILYYNQITIIEEGTFVNLPQLKEVHLFESQITMIEAGSFVKLPQLQKLWLYNNQITIIQTGTFIDLPQLQELYLFNSQITMLQDGAFGNLPKLRLLDLSLNKMSAISPLAFGLLPSNLVIKLGRNPWQCDCKMAPLRLDSTEFLTFKDQIFCTEPANLRGQKFRDVNPEDLVCPETTTSALPVDVQVTLKFNNSYKGTTAGSTVKNKKNKTRSTVASPLKSNSFHADTRATSINYNNCTAAGSTVGPAKKRAKTTVIISSTVKTTSDKPETKRSHTDTQITSNDYYNSTTADLKAGIALVVTMILTIWCKRRTKYPPPNSSSGPHSIIALRRLNMTGTVVINGHYYQTGPGQSQTITQSHANTTPVAVASGHDHQYEDIDRHTNLRQGQSQTITDSNTNTVATVMSAHDHQYEDVDNHHNQADQGQSLVNTKPLIVGNLSHDEVLAALKPNPMYVGVGASAKDQTSTAMISGQGQTGQGHSQAITEQYTNTTAAGVVTSGHDHQYIHVDNDHDQTGQGHSQAISESLEARNLSYGTGPTASQQNSLYKVVGQYDP